MTTSFNSIQLTIIIAVMNEADNIKDLATEIDVAFKDFEHSWEVLWVNDGSTDTTLEQVRELGTSHRWIDLDKNHGQSAALMAGVRDAQGVWIGTLDGDGQNDPVDLLKQYETCIARSVDMVNGIRAKRQDSFVCKICSRIANWTRNWLTGETVKDVGCSTRIVRRTAMLELPFFHGMHRFLPTLVRMRGYTICEISVNHRQRNAGKSKYGINNRLWSGFRDILAVRWLLRRQRIWEISDRGRSDS
ncbi:MAG: glycosyltransferase [Planctomycetes bacterium]|nr:glycosyltransferase [Planctomycetota bacterium]